MSYIRRIGAIGVEQSSNRSDWCRTIDEYERLVSKNRRIIAICVKHSTDRGDWCQTVDTGRIGAILVSNGGV